MSFVDLATLAFHRRQEIEARVKKFLEKCDIAIQDIEKLKSQACGFVDCLNCDPSELKERFLNSMRHLDEYTYLLTDFNLSVGKLDLPNNMSYTPPVQDQVHIPLMTPTVVGGYNLMDALSEPIPSTSKRCANMCPPEKEHRKRIPKEEQMLIEFSSTSCSSESVPIQLNETQEKQVQCKIEKEMKNLKLDDSAYTDDISLPAQSVLQIDHVYPACIMHTDGLTLWMITEDCDEIFDFLTDMTNFYKENSVELKMKDILGLTYCAYYDDDSACYYRALIIRLIEDDTVEVFLADTGEVRAAPLHTIQPLHPRFCNTPPYARCCHLAGIDQSFQSTEAAEQEVFIKNYYIGTKCKIKIDDNCSESLGVYVILPSGDTLNDLLVQNRYAQALDKCEPVSGPSRPAADLDDGAFNIDGPEFEDPVEAVTGYRNRDEMDICMHYKGEPDKMCFKGTRCKKRHVMMHPDGWTLDRVRVPARVPAPALPAPDTWVQVQVSHVASYDMLYLHLLNDDQPEAATPSFGAIVPPTTLAALVEDMNSPASRIAYKQLTMVPAPGEMVAALYPPDEQWYRARVVTATPANKNVEVIYVDYGNRVWVSEDSVRTLETRWCGLPAQAVCAKLAGVCLNAPAQPRLAAACKFLAALASNRTLDAHIVGRDYDEITVELYDEEGFSIVQELLTNPLFQSKEYTIKDEPYVKQKIVAA